MNKENTGKDDRIVSLLMDIKKELMEIKERLEKQLVEKKSEQVIK